MNVSFCILFDGMTDNCEKSILFYFSCRLMRYNKTLMLIEEEMDSERFNQVFNEKKRSHVELRQEIRYVRILLIVNV